MSDVAFGMNHVYKKFRRGEIFDSLRDLIPAVSKRLLKNNGRNHLTTNEFWALKDISFEVKRGEAFGIIGHNGAGKSTILKLLSRIMQPTKGYIVVNGLLSALIEVGAGFHPDLTGRENIFLNGTILGMKREQIKKRFEEIVEFSGLRDFIDTPVKRYSSGMYARLGFSVAAHVNPDILVVDEVLSVGDYVFQNKCIERMKSIVKEGVAVIFVSHNLRAVTEMCGRCILLDHGQIIKEGTSTDVVRHYLELGNTITREENHKDVIIAKTSFRGDGHGKLLFREGQKVSLEIELTARVACENLSLSVTLVDSNFYMVFNTSTERLTRASFSLNAGETKKIVFDMELHLAPGTYHFGAHIYRYDIQKLYDAVTSAATIYVISDTDVRGVANLYPQVSIE